VYIYIYIYIYIYRERERERERVTGRLNDGIGELAEEVVAAQTCLLSTIMWWDDRVSKWWNQ
jgi:hypothetical protein